MIARGIFAYCVLLLAGCAARLPPAAEPGSTRAPNTIVSISGPATGPNESIADLTLEQIQPRQPPPPTTSATLPAGPPLEAVRLFAKARLALLDGRRYEAVQSLQKAIDLDPDSFELHRSLGDAYAGADSRATDEWGKASAIDPDHLDLQVELGRAHLLRGKTRQAIEHLWLALHAPGYQQRDAAAGEADFFLARALQEQGYDRAALQMYERLLARLQNPPLGMRNNQQIAMLLRHPDLLALHIAALYEKHRAYDAALSLLKAISARAPDNFELQARVARDMAAAGHPDEAAQGAADLVVRFVASPQSLALLGEIAGNDAAAVDALRRARQRHPEDRPLVYALIDLLRAQGRASDASRLIAEASAQWPDDLRLLRRHVEVLRGARDLSGAGQVVIAALARRPDHDLELTPIWESLLRSSPGGRLRMADIESIHPPAGAEPARLLLVARAAELSQRDLVEREALRRAVAARPLFAPAWRQMLASIWTDDAMTTRQRTDAADRLGAAAAEAGDAGLAAELRGRALLDLGRPQQAQAEFADAVKAGDRAPELYLNFAAALHAVGDEKSAAALLWKVIRERPLVEQSYVELYALYDKQSDREQAQAVLTAWLTADPESAAAHQLEARDAIEQRNFAGAERILLGLLETHDSDPEVLSALQQFYFETDRPGEFTAKLEQHFALEPWNFTLGKLLTETYARQQHTAEAIRTLDRLRSLARADADLLYTVAGLYARIGRQRESDQVLDQIVKLDPSYAGASNDLGYSWAEQGKNLTRAEELVRVALRAEPDNPSFLDSVGWVLYKRGKFDEAVQALSRAAHPATQADPVVLDHLGDTLYRLGNQQKAAEQWRQAAQRLNELPADDTDERRQLRLQLLEKQRQLDAGQPVRVAPVVETTAPLSPAPRTTTN